MPVDKGLSVNVIGDGGAPTIVAISPTFSRRYQGVQIDVCGALGGPDGGEAVDIVSRTIFTGVVSSSLAIGVCHWRTALRGGGATSSGVLGVVTVTAPPPLQAVRQVITL